MTLPSEQRSESSPARSRRNTTIYDVARAAEVSHQSVSRYMRGLDMRPTTKEKIRHALEKLDYKPNLSARALITGRSLRVGALTHEAHHVGPHMIIQGATAAAREAGYLLDVVTLDMGDIDEISRALDSLQQYDLAGIIAFASTDSTREVFENTPFQVPLVVASEEDESDSTALVHSATRGIDAAVAHLAALGHRDLLHIAGPADWSAARNRRRAFQAAVSARGLNGAVLHGDWSAKSGNDVVESIAPHPAPTAIVAANDQMALGAIHALHRRGIRVPADVSVTGVDDTPEAPFFTPSLTTVRLDFRTQGRDALRQLLTTLGEAESRAPAAGALATPALVVRGSTGPALRRGINLQSDAVRGLARALGH